MRVAFLAALVALASAARADGFRGNLTAGTGIGRDFIGGQLEAGFGHWTALAGFGPLAFSNNAARPSSLALGARWSMRPDGSGFAVALQGMAWVDRGPATVDYRETVVIVAATAHWRWLLWHHLVLDVGAGPALSFDNYRFPTTDYGASNGRLHRTTCFGVHSDVAQCSYPFDLELGLGVAF